MTPRGKQADREETQPDQKARISRHPTKREKKRGAEQKVKRETDKKRNGNPTQTRKDFKSKKNARRNGKPIGKGKEDGERIG